MGLDGIVCSHRTPTPTTRLRDTLMRRRALPADERRVQLPMLMRPYGVGSPPAGHFVIHSESETKP